MHSSRDIKVQSGSSVDSLNYSVPFDTQHPYVSIVVVVVVVVVVVGSSSSSNDIV